MASEAPAALTKSSMLEPAKWPQSWPDKGPSSPVSHTMDASLLGVLDLTPEAWERLDEAPEQTVVVVMLADDEDDAEQERDIEPDAGGE